MKRTSGYLFITMNNLPPASIASRCTTFCCSLSQDPDAPYITVVIKSESRSGNLTSERVARIYLRSSSSFPGTRSSAGARDQNYYYYYYYYSVV